jgi:NADH-quinone oxidoreductase subunit G
VESLDGFVKRLIPRENQDVNDWWMCDDGRYGWRHLYSENRVLAARAGDTPVDDATAATTIHSSIAGAEQLAILVDPFLTCEELFLVQSMAQEHGNCIIGGWLPEEGQAAQFPSGFKISAARHPNRNGAEQILGDQLFEKDAERLMKALNGGEVQAVIAFCGGPEVAGPGSDWSRAIGNVQTRIVFSVLEGPWLDGATMVLPATAPLEKEGSWVNEDGRLQRTRSCWKPGAAPFTAELTLLQGIDEDGGSKTRPLSAAGIFRELADRCPPFQGHNHSDTGSHGIPLDERPTGVGADGGSR